MFKSRKAFFYFVDECNKDFRDLAVEDLLGKVYKELKQYIGLKRT